MLQLRKRADKSGDPPAEGEAWPLSHVELVGDAPREHNFADTVIGRYMADGFAEFVTPRLAATEATGEDGVTRAYSRNPVLTGDEIVLHLEGGDLRYRVTEHPGRYADENEPGGVRETHEYRTTLVRGK